MRIMMINPNSTGSMTEKIDEAARAAAGAGTEILTRSPSKNPASIEGYYDEALAAPGVLEEVARGEKEGIDGFVIACFGDPGLPAARELARAPVVGIAEAAMHVASLISDGFSIISMPARSLTGMQRLVSAYGMDQRCRRIRMIDMPILALEREDFDSRAVILEECRKAVQEDRADCVLLGCAGMANIAEYITERTGAQAIDGVAAAVKLVESLITLGLRTCKLAGYGPATPAHA